MKYYEPGKTGIYLNKKYMLATLISLITWIAYISAAIRFHLTRDYPDKLKAKTEKIFYKHFQRGYYNHLN